jgi:hypothetical protein
MNTSNDNDALIRLRGLFISVGEERRFESALKEECRNACLHGLIDAAYDEWGDASDHVAILCNERDCYPCDLSVKDLAERWPLIIFRDEPDWGFQFARGRLFSLRDYQDAKEALAGIGNDRFSKNFREAYGKSVVSNSHLWEE